MPGLLPKPVYKVEDTLQAKNPNFGFSPLALELALLDQLVKSSLQIFTRKQCLHFTKQSTCMHTAEGVCNSFQITTL